MAWRYSSTLQFVVNATTPRKAERKEFGALQGGLDERHSEDSEVPVFFVGQVPCVPMK
jgi:hypothetical protein